MSLSNLSPLLHHHGFDLIPFFDGFLNHIRDKTIPDLLFFPRNLRQFFAKTFDLIVKMRAGHFGLSLA